MLVFPIKIEGCVAGVAGSCCHTIEDVLRGWFLPNICAWIGDDIEWSLHCTVKKQLWLGNISVYPCRFTLYM